MKIKALLLIATICASCNEKTNQDKNLTHITITSLTAETEIRTSMFIEQSQLIPLETKETCIVGEIASVKNRNNNFYVSDEKSLFVFDNSGIFITKVAKNGIGADEYLRITDFDIDDNKNIYILSSNSKNVNIYDSTGVFFKRIDIDYYAEKLFICKNGDIWTYVGNELGATRNKIEVIRGTSLSNTECLSIDKDIASYLHSSTFNSVFSQLKDSDEVMFCEIYNDTIYRIEDGRISRSLVLDYDGKNIPKALFKKGYSNMMKFHNELSNGKYAYNLGAFWESDKYYMNKFFYEDEGRYALYDKNTTKCLVGNIIDDMWLNGFSIYPTFNVSTNSFIMDISADEIIDFCETHPDALANMQTKLIVENLNEDSNPILYYASIK